MEGEKEIGIVWRLTLSIWASPDLTYMRVKKKKKEKGCKLYCDNIPDTPQFSEIRLTPKVPRFEFVPWLFCIDREGGTCGAPFGFAVPTTAGVTGVARLVSDGIAVELMFDGTIREEEW